MNDDIVSHSVERNGRDAFTFRHAPAKHRYEVRDRGAIGSSRTARTSSGGWGAIPSTTTWSTHPSRQP